MIPKLNPNTKLTTSNNMNVKFKGKEVNMPSVIDSKNFLAKQHTYHSI